MTLPVHLCTLVPESSGLDFVLNYNVLTAGLFSSLEFPIFNISLNGLFYGLCAISLRHMNFENEPVTYYD